MSGQLCGIKCYPLRNQAEFDWSLLSSHCLVLFKWPMQCSWMFSRWENEQATSLFIPSHTAIIILSAVNVKQRRGRHNKSSGREALRPSLGAKPVILHLKWSCKRSQVALQWHHRHHTNDMMKLCNEQVPTCCFFFFGWWENETTENRRFSTLIESVCLMKNWSTVGRTTAP